MTKQNSKQTLEELIKIFRHNFPHLYDLYVDREQSGSFSEGENAEVFIKKAYEAGQEAEKEKNERKNNKSLKEGLRVLKIMEKEVNCFLQHK